MAKWLRCNRRVKMNINKSIYLFSCIFILAFVAGCSSPEGVVDSQPVGRQAKIEPDYTGIVIPPNIAPLNFSIKEPGRDYFIRIQSKNGDPIRIKNTNGNVQIPIKAWKNLLANNVGQRLITEIFVQHQSGAWIRFDTIVNQISQDSIDGYLTFRRFGSLYNIYKKLGIYQRSIEDFSEKPVLVNRLTQNNCMNCHNFYQNKTDRWLLHLRGGPGTCMLLMINNKATKIDLKTKFNGPAAYPAWHPSGELIAFSVSKLMLFFHEVGNCRDVLDRYSDIIVYDIPTNTVTTTPEIASPDRMEIWPAWTPDGRYLYFCSAPKIETFEIPNKQGELSYEKIKYDLMRIEYDPVQKSWGKLETVISADKIGLSITEPRVSPDGKFLLFTGAAYSQFPIYLQSADVYLLDLETGIWKKLDINTDRPDSFHSWSSNGRWFVFSSRRIDNVFTRPFFTHFDSLGNTTKPFVLPQEDVSDDEQSLQVYNVPELTKEPVHISPQELAQAAFGEKDTLVAKLDPKVLLAKTENKPTPNIRYDMVRKRMPKDNKLRK